MYFAIVCIFLLSIVVIVLVQAVVVTFQGPPFQVEIKFFLLKVFFSLTPLKLEIIFFKKKILPVENLARKIVLKIYYTIFPKNTKKKNFNTNENHFENAKRELLQVDKSNYSKSTSKPASQILNNNSKPTHAKKRKKTKSHYKKFIPFLVIKLLSSIKLKKLEILISFEEFSFAGILYAIRQFLPKKIRTGISISFTEKSSHYCVVFKITLSRIIFVFFMFFIKTNLYLLNLKLKKNGN